MTYCQIVWTAIALPNGATRASCECLKHGMVDFSHHGQSDILCPIGKIESATDIALAKIANAMKGAGL